MLKSKEDITPCLLNCSNNGICLFIGNQYKCKCNSNFVGTNCEINKNPCLRNPCFNNGTCMVYKEPNNKSNSSVEDQIYDFNCNCSRYYIGQYCEVEIDMCKNETCNGNGNWNNDNSIPRCNCFLYYNGTRCDIKLQALVFIDKVTRTSSIIAISVILITVLYFILTDVTRCSKKNKMKFKESNLKDKSSLKQTIKNAQYHLEYKP